MCAVQNRDNLKRKRDASPDGMPKKAIKITKAMPSKEVNSHDYLMSFSKAKAVRGSELNDFFYSYTDSEIEAYGFEVTSAIRSRNLDKVKDLHRAGQTLQCSNRFGESIMHMACRQGSYDLVKFLLKEANVNLRIKDDYGRTPLHDAFWNITPNVDLVNLLIEECPSLLFVTDVRGHAPLQYTRVEHNKFWVNFLEEREPLIRQGLEDLQKATKIES